MEFTPSQLTEDDIPSRRPRDTRLIHALLSSLSVPSYQERVPLMLIDFAYRYTRSVLADAASLDVEGYGPETRGGRNKQDEGVSLTSLRMAVAARQAGQISPVLGKSDLAEMALETNRVGLPRVAREFGIRLPEERFILTGGGYGLLEEWEEEEEVVEEAAEPQKLDVDAVMGEDGDDENDNGLLGEEDVDDDEFQEVMGDTKMTDA